ncbi:MAG: NAD-dependent epimerase/dehydratase family protein [Myxococcota bacterium]|nr:NAD-dependent epimerase/dehydratase family protein [Myxococcota bacterium]
MKLLITGAGGFVGGALVRAARAEGHDVTRLLRSARGLPSDGVPTIGVELGANRTGAGSLTEALAGIEVVVHCAGRIRGSRREEFVRDNLRATAEVLASAKLAGVRRVVHVGSTAVYGDRAAERGTVTEDSPLGYRISRLDWYSRTKLQAEEQVLAAIAAGGLEVVSVRPGWIVGPEDPTLASLGERLGGMVFPLVGSGRNRLPVTSIGSVTRALLLAATSEEGAGRVYNLAQDEEITQRSFFEALAAAAGVKPRFLPVPARMLGTAGLAAEILAALVPGFEAPVTRNAVALLGLDALFPTERIRKELGWEPVAPISEVLRDALADSVLGPPRRG